MICGAAGFVLPFKLGVVYVEIDTGDDFGQADIVDSAQEVDLSVSEFIIASQARRGFTV